jgi:hypothetical protein
MSHFDLKLIPKAREEITKYVNFMPADLINFKDHCGKIIYINTGYPGKHIYSAYYVTGSSANVLSFEEDGKKELPAFTIDELSFTDVIGFYTVDKWKEYTERVKKTKSKPATKP